MGELEQTFEKQRYPDELPSWSFKEIRDRIPARLHEKSTFKSLLYAARGVILGIVFFAASLQIEPTFARPEVKTLLGPTAVKLARYTSWAVYWWFQGLVFTGFWVVGHECGHGAFSDDKLINHVLGYVMHTGLLTPYFSWRTSHHRHHSNHASMEKDETYVPKTRKDLGIAPTAAERDIKEVLEDTPLYSIFMLVRQQIFAFDAYLVYNVSGQMNYPWWTSHFNPKSVIFKDSQFWEIVSSDVGMIGFAALLVEASKVYGYANMIKHYIIPWMFVHHWIVMITYLHHTDPVLPHFRQSVWNFQRGATATIDRDFLGWQGRFFFYDVAHFHVAHHFFPRMPWYHCEEATKYLREVLGQYYFHTEKPSFQTLWDNYNFCQFVDDDGDVVYYRNKEGKTIHDLDKEAKKVKTL